MLEFDPKTITIRELLTLYNRVGSAGEEGKGPKKPRSMPAILKKYENMSAYDFFYEDDEVSSEARKAMSEASKKGSIPKATTQTFRYLSNLLSKGYERNPPNFLAKKPDDPSEAERLFGLKEAPKATAKIAVTQDPKKLQQFFDQLAEYEVKNPDQASAIRAIHFGLNTGLRPSAYVMVPSSNKEVEAGSGLFSYQYKDQSGSLFIEGESTGAKARDISVPLNNTADVKLQEQIIFNRENGLIPDVEAGADAPSSRIFLNTDGSPVTSKQVNAILAQIKVPEFIYDSKSRTYYDNFMLDKTATTKKGMQIFRNFHTQYGKNTLGIPLNVLAKIQGRSVKSTRMDEATGSLLEYDEDFPGEVSDYERQMANKFTAQYAPMYDTAIERAKLIKPDYNFDYGDPEKTLITKRIGRSTQGLERYFNAPPIKDLKPIVADVTQQIADEAGENPVDAEKMKPKISAYLERLRKFNPSFEADEEEIEKDVSAITAMGELLGSDTGPKTLTMDTTQEQDKQQDNRSRKPFGSTVLDPIGRAITKMTPTVRALEVGKFAIEKLPPMLEGAMQSETTKKLGETLLAPYELDESSTDEEVFNAMQDFAARTKGYR